ncbi:MAG: hypothetical protein HQ581_24810 [Planctomycetes bacterium]|nr:hypothetical protein [Planctomycetota bacterium]
MKYGRLPHIAWLGAIALGIALLTTTSGSYTRCVALGQDQADPFGPPKTADPFTPVEDDDPFDSADDENPFDSAVETEPLAPGLPDRGTGLSDRGSWKSGEVARPLSLDWLVKKQAGDGSWSFAESENPFEDTYSNPGKCPSRCGATGLALLAFLGAGQTHQEGQFQRTIDEGLKYLLDQFKSGPHGANLCGEGDRMVWHGIATLALCEAYAMTRDPALENSAQRALDFIAAVQDKRSGGWPARLGGKPSPVASACQILAMKSGHMGYLKVNPKTVRRAARYFDAELSNDRTEMVAGLLARMLIGGETSEPAMRRAVRRIVKRGPVENDVVHNYFAHQVIHYKRLRESDKSQWIPWYSAMREQLVDSQIGDGDERGSWWNPRDVRARQGGRLLQTALSTLTLEVYYGHLPIYSSKSAEGGLKSPGSYPMSPKR